MRHTGRITDWRDDRGFGFVTPAGGGRPVFVHFSAFSDRYRRPKAQDVVTYRLGTDQNGRPRAVQVAYAEQGRRSAPNGGPVLRALAIATAFLSLVAGVVIAGRLPIEVLFLYLVASFVAFVIYAVDKSAARASRWRTPENTLHVIGLVGGWPGALIAQQVFRHKSSKRSFQLIFWGTVAINCGALGWLFSSQGARALQLLLGAG